MYNRLFSKIVRSSVWTQSVETRLVWITLLAMMDKEGYVDLASPSNVAHQARISVEDARKALTILESPDWDSSDPEHGGRRIEKVPGGWMVLNGPKYSAIAKLAELQEANRSRIANYRAKKKAEGQ